MKNLKKVLALVVVFAMMVSSVAFAAIYPDVAADADYANAVSVLSDLGMIKGDDKGNFNPDATITRAEFATMITRLLGVESAATGKANFDDVAADHWATGYIAMAQQQGIIAGYGDGKFGPENPVKYEEAVKMLVCALGYEQMAVAKGGWVAGYLTTAYQIGLLDGANGTQGAGAPRSLVAQLCYNALDIPMMEQTGFGTDVKYEIMKKTDDHDKVTLLTKMGIYKLGGIVAANEKVPYKSAATVTDKGFVTFWWDDDFDSPVKNWSKKTSANPVIYAYEGKYFGEESLITGETDIADAIGNQLIAYVKKGVSKYEVLAYEIDATSTSMTIKADVLGDDSELLWNGDSSNFYPEIRYYAEEGASKTKKLALEFNTDSTSPNYKKATYTVIWNNDLRSAADLTSGTFKLDSTKNAVIELVDFDDNNKIDVVKVTEYSYAVVKEVSAARGTVTDRTNSRIDFAIDDEDVKVSITDINGNALELKDIAEGDVLAMVVNVSTGSSEQADLKNATYDSLDVVVLKDNFVTGAIESWDEGANAGTYNGDEMVIIGGKEYDIKGTAKNDCDKINLQAEGKYWLAIDGETIIAYEGDIAKSGNYAYIVNAYWANNKETDKKVTLELITKDGLVEYKLADRIKFVAQNGTSVPVDCDAVLNTAADNTTWASQFNTADKAKTVSKAIYDEYVTANTTAVTLNETETARRMIKISVNASNEITAITPVASSRDEKTQFNYQNATGEYRADAKKIGSKVLLDSAVVLELDQTDVADSKFTDVGYFVDESTYSALMLDVDANGDYAAAVVYSSDAVYTEGDTFAIVKSKVTALDEEGNDITKVTVVKDGEEKVLVFDQYSANYFNRDASGNSINTVSQLKIGSVIIFKTDAKDVVKYYDVIGNITYSGGVKTFNMDSTIKAKMTAKLSTKPAALDFEDGESYFYGYIAKSNGNKLQVVYDAAQSITTSTTNLPTVSVYAEDDTTTVTALDLTVSGGNQYTLTGAKESSTVIKTGDFKLGNVQEMYLKDANSYANPADAGTDNDTDGVADDKYEVHYVFIKTFEGEVVDIMSIDIPATSVKTVKPFDGTPFTAPSVVAPVAPVVEEKAEVKEEIVELEGFDL